MPRALHIEFRYAYVGDHAFARAVLVETEAGRETGGLALGALCVPQGSWMAVLDVLSQEGAAAAVRPVFMGEVRP